MLHTVLKNSLNYTTFSLSSCQEAHEGGLKIGGESRKGPGVQIQCLDLAGCDAKATFLVFKSTTTFFKLIKYHSKTPGNYRFY